MSQQTIIRNAWICPVNDQNEVEPFFGDLVIQDQHIVDLIRRPADEHKSVNHGDELDAAGRLLTLPQVNFHEHIYSRLAKGLPISGAMGNFAEILKNLWWKIDLALDLPMVKASAQMAAMECLQNGVTYLFDHHASPSAISGSLKTIAQVLESFGLRSVLCFEVSDRNGEEVSQISVEENVHFIENETTENSQGMLGLHALFTLDDQTLQTVASEMHRLQTGIHIHVAEDAIDVQENQQKYGKTLIQRLADFNLLNNRSLLIHGVHLTKDDYALIRDSGAALVYNPDSNLNNAVGLPDYLSVPKEIPILMGTDGMHANVGRSLKQVFLLLRHQKHTFDQSFAFVQKVFKDQLNFVRHYFGDFPHLHVGDRADFVLWNYVPPTPVLPQNFCGHFIYGLLESSAFAVFQAGKKLLWAGQFVQQPISQIQQNIFQQGQRLYATFAKE